MLELILILSLGLFSAIFWLIKSTKTYKKEIQELNTKLAQRTSEVAYYEQLNESKQKLYARQQSEIVEVLTSESRNVFDTDQL
jgi:hypothetical protein